MLRRRLAAVLLPLALAACTTGQTSSTGSFKGEEKQVAQVVEDLQAAGEKKDAGEICSRILAPELVDELSAPGRSCTQEVDEALDDAESFALDVEDVQISGSGATARVKDGDDAVREVRLVKQGAAWKISALPA